MKGNEPVVIPNSEGKRTHLFCSVFKENLKVGDPAKKTAITNPNKHHLFINYCR